jgi:D-sedoheptulose 7-phosphate isomerase
VSGILQTGTPGVLASTDAPELVREHILSTAPALRALSEQSERLASWARELATRLSSGHRLLVAGNGGSAAETQHLTAELVGRFSRDRRPFSAIALSAETSSITAIGNDYGFDDVFARQVRAHGRSGDVLLLLSTSGRSRNLLNAARAASELGITSWAMTGGSPNPLEVACDEAIALDASNAHVQEAQLVAVHALCVAFDAHILGEQGSQNEDQNEELSQERSRP